MPRSAGVRARYPAIARALLRRLAWESRTSFGAPVEPDVLRSSARSGCSSRATARPAGARCAGRRRRRRRWRRRPTPRRARRRGRRRAAGTWSPCSRARYVVTNSTVFEASRIDQRARGQVELAGALMHGRREPGVGHDVVAGDERRRLGRAGAEQDRGDPLGGHPASAPTQYKACLPSDASRASRCGLQPERPLAWRLDDHSDPPPDGLHPRARSPPAALVASCGGDDGETLTVYSGPPLRHRDGVRDVVGGVRRQRRVPHRQRRRAARAHRRRGRGHGGRRLPDRRRRQPVGGRRGGHLPAPRLGGPRRVHPGGAARRAGPVVRARRAGPHDRLQHRPHRPGRRADDLRGAGRARSTRAASACATPTTTTSSRSSPA